MEIFDYDVALEYIDVRSCVLLALYGRPVRLLRREPWERIDPTRLGLAIDPMSVCKYLLFIELVRLPACYLMDLTSSSKFSLKRGFDTVLAV